MTAPATYGLTEEQKRIRMGGIGASESAAVVGRSTFAGPMDVWLRKKRPGAKKDISNQAPVKWGHRLEDVVLTAYEEEMQRQLLRGTAVGTIRNEKYPYLLCTPDAYDVTDLEIDPGGEFSSVSDACIDSWRRRAHRIVQAKTCRFPERHHWGPQGTDEIPEHYLIQVQVEMGVSGLTQEPAHLPVLFGGSDFRVYEVHFQPSLFEFIHDRCARFWVDHVLADKPPTVDGSDAWSEWLAVKLAERKTKIVKRAATEEEVFLLHSLDDVKRRLDAVMFEHSGVVNRLKNIIGDGYGLEARDIGRALFTGGEKQWENVTDWKAVADALILAMQANGQREVVAEAIKAATTRREWLTQRALRFYPEKER